MDDKLKSARPQVDDKLKNVLFILAISKFLSLNFGLLCDSAACRNQYFFEGLAILATYFHSAIHDGLDDTVVF